MNGDGDGVEEWRNISLAVKKKEKMAFLKNFVRNRVQSNMTVLEAKRVRGYILASLGEF